ncbi:phosphate acyltransferase PlsX [Inmirania thermothiophila]|uniref:Phosphate acyltransferase n=1 Tax=Inmirania thermothiophila TaxID=1750597 RepID=A0A3N1Y1D4_9GAMM|nr:phosphate acyltransferase PlsX [Inmirania thermothiophila]ROR32635.1 phosphate:acyl-[acyl carrier protein] acyltransferase [Inmirania thermothiophila]
MSETVIALDAMGGDHGPAVVLPAAARALAEHPDLHLVLVGDEAVLRDGLGAIPAAHRGRVELRHASQVVAMDEPPAQALRSKRDSSMRVAVNLVREGAVQACVSAGNTGALMAIARFVLKTLPGIDRPAICTAIPAIDGHTYVLDLGANVALSAEHLFQFAVMGSVLCAAIDGKASPRVGLLNIGEEEIKGIDEVKEAARLLAASDLNYVGYVEGDGIYLGAADVVVCDGFVGNVMLKASEGVAKMIRHYMRETFGGSLYGRLAALVAMPVLRRLGRRIDPRRYNGASLLGLQGIVIKSHGGADALAFANAIGIARAEARKQVPERIDSELEKLLGARAAS